MTTLKVVVAVTSPLAFSYMEKTSIIHASFAVARAFTIETGVPATIAIATSDPSRIEGFECEVLVCDPNLPQSLARALAESSACDIVAIHDALRPLTRITQFHRTLGGLVGDVDAVRPAAAFTESLKIVNGSEIIDHSVDRTSMMRISTPEMMRFSAIDFNAVDSTWFLPLKVDAKIATVDADPESLRVNSESEIELMESFIHWRQSVATS